MPRMLVVLMAVLGLGALVVGVALATANSGGSGAKTATDAAGVRTLSIEAGGRKRSYLLYVPPGDSAKHPLPLVLVYHGADNTDWDAASQSGLLSYAQRSHKMIVAFPQGYDDTWNDEAGETPATQAKVNDIAFTEALLRKTEADYHVQRSRVAATGFSNGAIFVELVGCQLASYFTLIVPVEGQLATGTASACHPAKPISVYEVHATGDRVIPYAGGTFSGVGGPVSVLSAAASATRWAGLDRCLNKPATVHSDVAGGSTLTQYKRCDSDVSVTLESIQGGSHEWPPGFATTLAQALTAIPPKSSAAEPPASDS